MKFSRVTAAILMASLSSPLLAASEQSVGTLTSASQGTIVARDGKLIAGRQGQTLFAGDRVITRGNSKASVAMSGCNVALAPTSILTVSSAPCAQPQSFTAQSDDNKDGTGAATSDGGMSTEAVVIAVVAVAAAAGGVIAATSNSNSSPTSP